MVDRPGTCRVAPSGPGRSARGAGHGGEAPRGSVIQALRSSGSGPGSGVRCPSSAMPIVRRHCLSPARRGTRRRRPGGDREHHVRQGDVGAHRPRDVCATCGCGPPPATRRRRRAAAVATSPRDAASPARGLPLRSRFGAGSRRRRARRRRRGRPPPPGLLATPPVQPHRAPACAATPDDPWMPRRASASRAARAPPAARCAGRARAPRAPREPRPRREPRRRRGAPAVREPLARRASPVGGAFAGRAQAPRAPREPRRRRGAPGARERLVRGASLAGGAVRRAWRGMELRR